LRSALVVVVAVTLTACGGDDGNGYPREAVETFVTECDAQPNATERQCRCVIARLEETMPYDEFARADKALEQEQPVDEKSLTKLRRAVQGCR
jgi:hypothetical protein